MIDSTQSGLLVLKNITLLLYSYFLFVYFSMLANPTALEYLIYFLGAVYLLFYCKQIVLTPPFIFCVLIAAIPAISWLLMQLQHPQLNAEMLGLREYLRMAFFLPLALMLRGEMRWIKILVAAFLLGLFFAPWVAGGLEAVLGAFAGSRLSFHLNPIRAGILLTAAIILLLIYYQDVFKRPFSSTLIAFFLIAALYFSVMLLLTQSRSALVALAAGLFATALVFMAIERIKLSKNTVFFAALLTLVFLLFFYYLIQKLGLVDKTLPELQMVWSVITGQKSEIPNTSWGYRLQMWLLGVEYFMARPLSGWGNQGGELIMSLSGNAIFIERFDQLHNAYIEVLVRYGFFYLFLLWAFFLWVGWLLYLGYRQGVLVPCLFYPLLLLLLFYFFANFFGSFLVRSDTERLFPILFGISVSFYFQRFLVNKPHG